MNLQVGVKVLLRDPEGRVLLLKRSEATYGATDGVWDIPGGRIDPGTTLLTNLAREVQEETGLTLTGTPRLIAAQDILRGTEKHVVRLTYAGEAEGEITLDPREATEYRWAPLSELSDASVDAYVRELASSGVLTDASWRA